MTREEALEILDDIAADDPLHALREFPHLIDPYRLDACASAEPAAALVHAYHLLTPERRATCEAAARSLHRFIPDRLEPERRVVLGIKREAAVT